MHQQLQLNIGNTKTDIKLFPYQEEAKSAFIKWYNTPNERESLIALATGLGKTITACACVQYVLENGGKILWITHRDEMVGQSSRALEELTGESVGIEKATQRAEYTDKIVVASVQSLKGKRLYNFSQFFTPALIVFDEAHHSIARTWVAIKLNWPEVKVLNLTATPYRQDIGKRLSLGKVLIEKNTSEGIAMKRLVPPTPVGTLGVSLKGCKISMGDYDTYTLSRILMQPDIVAESVALIKKHITGRRGIIFAANVEHGKLLADALDEAGIRSKQIYAETPRDERQHAYNQIRSGELNVLINNMVLTEGFDLPELDLVAIFRPTKNAALYLQMLGRGLRTAPNKKDCLVIDAVDIEKRTTGRSKLKLPTEVELKKHSAFVGEQKTLLELFLSWFYRQEEIATHLLEPEKEITYTKITNGYELFKALCPGADMHKLRDAQLEMITNMVNLVSNTQCKNKNVIQDLAVIAHCGHAEGLVSVLASNGWNYYPMDSIPQTEEEDEKICQENEEALTAVEESYTMEYLAKVEPSLQNFILDVMQTSSLNAQAKKYFIRHNAFGIEASWTIPLDYVGQFTFIRLPYDKPIVRNFLVRDELTGRIYETHAYGGKLTSWTEVSSANYLIQRIPPYSRSSQWTKSPATDKQLPHVARILQMPIEKVSEMKLCAMAAACLMENNFSKPAIKAIAKKISGI